MKYISESESGMTVHLIDGGWNTGLYVVTDPYEHNGQIYYKAPVYHVWVNGYSMISTTALYEAQAVWSRYKNNKERNEIMATKKEKDEVQAYMDATEKVNQDCIIQKNRETIITMLKKHTREGMDLLIEHMDEIGFFTAPASSSNHCHYEGGLAQHSLNVAQMAEKIGVTLYGGEGYNKIQDSVVVAALLHDLGKCGDYDKHLYVENILKSGNR